MKKSPAVPGLAQIVPEHVRDNTALPRHFDQLDEAIQHLIQQQKLAA